MTKKTADKMFAGYDRATFLARADWHADRQEDDQADFWRDAASWMAALDEARTSLARPATSGLGPFADAIGLKHVSMPTMQGFSADRWTVTAHRRGASRLELTLGYRAWKFPACAQRVIVSNLGTSQARRRHVLLTLLEHARRVERVTRSAPRPGDAERYARQLAAWLRDLDVPHASESRPQFMRTRTSDPAAWHVPFGADTLIEVGDFRLRFVRIDCRSEHRHGRNPEGRARAFRERILSLDDHPVLPGNLAVDLPGDLRVSEASYHASTHDPYYVYRRMCVELLGQARGAFIHPFWHAAMPSLTTEEHGLPWTIYPA